MGESLSRRRTSRSSCRTERPLAAASCRGERGVSRWASMVANLDAQHAGAVGGAGLGRHPALPLVVPPRAFVHEAVRDDLGQRVAVPPGDQVEHHVEGGQASGAGEAVPVHDEELLDDLDVRVLLAEHGHRDVLLVLTLPRGPPAGGRESGQSDEGRSGGRRIEPQVRWRPGPGIARPAAGWRRRWHESSGATVTAVMTFFVLWSWGLDFRSTPVRRAGAVRGVPAARPELPAHLEVHLVTAGETAGGYVIAVVIGVPLSMLVAFSPFPGADASPLSAVALEIVPKIHVRANLRYLVGLGSPPKIIIVFMVCFFPSC